MNHSIVENILYITSVCTDGSAGLGNDPGVPLWGRDRNMVIALDFCRLESILL